MPRDPIPAAHYLEPLSALMPNASVLGGYADGPFLRALAASGARFTSRDGTNTGIESTPLRTLIASTGPIPETLVVLGAENLSRADADQLARRIEGTPTRVLLVLRPRYLGLS